MVSADFDINQIQGNILRGYRMNVVRHLMLEVVDVGAARRFLAVSGSGGNDDTPGVTRGAIRDSAAKPDVCFNLGFTFEGLKALGTPASSLATFPTEFIEGMPARALKLGDFGASAPKNWAKPFNEPTRLHVIASIYAQDTMHLDRVQKQVMKSFRVVDFRDGRNLPGNRVFFDYVDSISQPRFVEAQDPDNMSNEPADPLGTALLGYPTRLEGLMFRVPSPPALGHCGTFNAFRVMAQDVVGFEHYLDRAAKELLGHSKVDLLLPPGEEERFPQNMTGRGEAGKHMTRFEALREIVAAQMCGRWRNGSPLATMPDSPRASSSVSLTDFEYDALSRCPAGAHVRRVNPRGGQIVQRVANYTRRLIRRGMSYGPDFDPAKPDDNERGLIGNFIGASIGAQFEAVMCDWLNLGLHDPSVTGANDPLIGANTSETSWFDLSLPDGDTIRLRHFPRFVHTRGGAYTFLPSLQGIEYLSTLGD